VKIHGRKALTILALPALLAVLAIAGCGGGGESSSAGSAYGGGGSESSSAGSAYGGGEGASGGANAAATTESGGAYGGRYGASSGSAASQGGAATIAVGNAGDLGTVLVDSNGMTVYDFHKDKGTTSSCYGACEQNWPPVTTTGAPKASGGAQSGMLGTTERKDGTMQVTYAGHPLYTFIQDMKPGDAKGNDVDFFGGEWYALQPNGQEPED
jgi:predicted lipoprotein with Yx(FWY)xxD motif